MALSSEILFLTAFLVVTFNATSFIHIDQQSTINPALSNGSKSLPFPNISYAFLNANISDCILFLVKTDSAYTFPDSFPINAQILIEPWPSNFTIYFI